MCKEYMVEKSIIKKTETFTEESICKDVYNEFNVEVDVETVQMVLSSYIADGIVSNDTFGYKKSSDNAMFF